MIKESNRKMVRAVLTDILNGRILRNVRAVLVRTSYTTRRTFETVLNLPRARHPTNCITLVFNTTPAHLSSTSASATLVPSEDKAAAAAAEGAECVAVLASLPPRGAGGAEDGRPFRFRVETGNIDLNTACKGMTLSEFTSHSK